MNLKLKHLLSIGLPLFSYSVIANEEPPRLNTTPLSYSQANHGGVGLLQIPTARMLNEGDFTLSYKDNEEYRFWTASLQLFDWMEATARYTDFRNLLFSDIPEFSGDQTAKDKGVDVKVRLVKESMYIPQLAIGFRDFGGTGFFESEYLMASKRIKDFDFHLGVGWGYLGNAGTISNPFCDLSDRFCTRGQFNPDGSDLGGEFEVEDFFSGNASIIGGIEYQTPWEPLRLKIEYEGNNYKNERAEPLIQDSRWNFGANYRYQGFDLSLSWERGNTFGFGVNYTFNFHTANQYKVQPKKESLKERKPDVDIAEVDETRLAGKVSESGIIIKDFELEDDKFVVFGARSTYRDQDEALERIGRVIAARVPDSVKTYHVVESTGAMPLVETVIDAEKFIEIANQETMETDLSSAYTRRDPASEILALESDREFTGFFGDVSTFWSQTFGSPEAFYLFQVGLNLNGGYAFNENVALRSSARVNLLDNFDNFNFRVDAFQSPVPRVRTLIREYIEKSSFSVDRLFLHWTDRIAPNLYGQAYGGYLELMYGGVGGELFYQEVDSDFGFGLDLNFVQQRSFENDYDFRDYKAFTGHFSVYWQPDFWEDVQISANIGQFLAKDKGINLEFARRFDSGVVVGAYAAITEIPPEEYGEGSFTKGFYLSIPFDIFSLRPSRSRGRIPWVPIARDGGQPLSRPMNLYDVLTPRSPFYD